jgi:hypothetical protein
LTFSPRRVGAEELAVLDVRENAMLDVRENELLEVRDRLGILAVSALEAREKGMPYICGAP